jgi:hypothetical protein
MPAGSPQSSLRLQRTCPVSPDADPWLVGANTIRPYKQPLAARTIRLLRDL